VDEGPLAGPQVNPALRLQAVQRLADRLPAHAELAGQVGFDEMLTRPEPAANDEFHQGLVDRLAQRHRPLDWADGPRIREVADAHEPSI
jgi:hypothetical protein